MSKAAPSEAKKALFLNRSGRIGIAVEKQIIEIAEKTFQAFPKQQKRTSFRMSSDRAIGGARRFFRETPEGPQTR